MPDAVPTPKPGGGGGPDRSGAGGSGGEPGKPPSAQRGGGSYSSEPSRSIVGIDPRPRLARGASGPRLVGCSEEDSLPPMRKGRFCVSTVGFDPNLQLLGSDPWASPAYTGLLIPTTPTTDAQHRYLFMLARAQFNAGERVRLVGFRQYLDIAGNSGEIGGLLRIKEVTSPMWRFPDGNVSWHVQIVPKGNSLAIGFPANNTPGFVQGDSLSPALLTAAVPGGPYVPPNAGRPFGQSIIGDLGNIHDMRFPWRSDQAEDHELDLPIPAPCDVVVYASVWQHTSGVGTPTFNAAQAAAAAPEDAFWAAFSNVQYNRIAAALIFEEDMIR